MLVRDDRCPYPCRVVYPFQDLPTATPVDHSILDSNCNGSKNDTPPVGSVLRDLLWARPSAEPEVIAEEVGGLEWTPFTICWFSSRLLWSLAAGR